MMSHDPYLLPDLNLIQIEDQKIRRKEIKFSWKKRVVPQLLALCVGMRKNRSDFFFTPTHNCC